MFPITERAVQKHLKAVCDYLGYTNISTHSFRKWYATDIYNATGHDIILVQRLLQHSSPSVTRRYIGISDERIESAIANHVHIVA
jgi:site-specific recombinase XerD